MTTAADGYPLADLMWTFVLFFGLLIYFWLLVTVLTDVIRRRELSGWAKAGWIALVVIVPWIGSIAYLITQGRAMGERDAQDHVRARQGVDRYIRSVAAPGTRAVDEIARGKELLDRGAISQDEFEQLKRRALI
jgi:Short C-terminal domain/Phospholipase_D-nuclease N-terminal